MIRKFVFVFTLALVFTLSFMIFGYGTGGGKNFALRRRISVKDIGEGQGPVKIKLIFGGDVMLGRSVKTKANSLGSYDFTLEKISDYLKSSDLSGVNLENPIIEKCPKHDSGYKFCSDPESIEPLVKSGIDVVSVANNHSGNYGKSGLNTTKHLLSSSGIGFADSQMYVKEINNLKFGILAFDLTFQKLRQEELDLISESKALVDFLIVMPHWGFEYRSAPESSTRSWAHQMVGKGADLIIGNHPHWVQGVDCRREGSWEYWDREVMQEKLAEEICGNYIFYSLGNLVFDQMWSEETRHGALVEFEIKNKSVSQASVRRIYIESVGQPKMLDD